MLQCFVEQSVLRSRSDEVGTPVGYAEGTRTSPPRNLLQPDTFSYFDLCKKVDARLGHVNVKKARFVKFISSGTSSTLEDSG